MNKILTVRHQAAPGKAAFTGRVTMLLLTGALTTLAGCGGGQGGKQKDAFFTSGSREADQRAMQRMAKDQQLSGTSAAEQDKAAKPGEEGSAQAPTKTTLFERLGGEPGITAIVDDFTQRALEDPRVNWQRKGVKSGGIFGRKDSAAWTANPQNVATLKKHLVQFLSLATGGPAQYDGKNMKSTHAGMGIGNPEFDATIGDLKASLDKLQIPTQEQKELLAIIESTRPQVVTER
jgi:hemoglobin